MTTLPQQIVSFGKLKGDGPFEYQIAPDAGARKAIAAALGLLDLRKFRATITVNTAGQRDWKLRTDWGATVVQPCVVTLEPVVTRLDQTDHRLYLADMAPIADEEIEMPEDDSVEAIPHELDLVAVAMEMLALALPAYPRVEGAEVETKVFAEDGVTPMTDEDAKPFAGLAALRDSLGKS